MATPGKAATATAKPTTLLDVHEVEWITRELERLLVRESGGGGGGSAVDGHHHHRRKRAKASPAAQKPHAEKEGGLLSELLGKHAVSICGDGTVPGAAAGVSGPRRRRGRGGFREVDKV